MTLRFLSLVCFFLFSHSAAALSLNGEGYGATRDEARKQALASLSEALQVEVKSETDILKSTESGTQASNRVHTLSELPLLGVEFTFHNKANEKYCISYLDTAKASTLYKEKLSLLKKEFSNMRQQLSQTKRTEQYALLSDMLSKHDQFEKYLLVARFIGLKNTPSLGMSASNIKGQMLTIESAVPSLALAAKLLTRDLPGERVYVYPAMPRDSQEATELSRVFRDKVASNMKTFSKRERALYVMKGYYDVHKDGISVTYRLIDDFGETHATRVVKLSKAAYKNIAYKPKSVDFSKLLHEGYVVSNKFHAEINTNRGKTDLLFTDGEEVKIFVRMNNPGYFYIVAHNTTNNSSYLMELNESEGRRKFVQYVNADQANRWISLGAFEVGAPYGVENLQLIASNMDVVDQLPSNKYEKETELYMLNDNVVEKAVIKTRGLKKKSTKKKTLTSEATLTLTTMKNH